MINKKRKTQSINEYALIIGIIAVVLVSMQTYFKRGINGLIYRTANEIGDVAKDDWTKYYADRGTNYRFLTAQTLGVMEPGLLSYRLHNNPDGTVKFLKSDTTKTFRLTEDVKGSAVKTRNDYDERTVFNGGWTSVNRFDSLGTFTAKEKKED